MNPLDHNAMLNRLRSGNRPDRGGSPTTGFIAQQKLVKQVGAAVEKMDKVQLAMFWLHKDFSALSSEDCSAEYVIYRLEHAARIDKLARRWEKDHNLQALVVHVLVPHLVWKHNKLRRRATGGGTSLGNANE